MSVAVVVGVIGLLSIAAVVTEWWLRRRLVPLLSRQVSQALRADADLLPDEGSLLTAVVRRFVSHVRLVASDVPLADGQARLQEVVVDLTGIHLQGPLRKVNPTFDDARFTARLQWADVSPAVPLPSYLKAVDVVSDGLRLTTLAGVIFDAHVELHPGKVRVRPTGSVLRLLPTQNVVIDIPPLPLGARIDEMALGDGTVELVGTLDVDELASAIAR